MGWYTNFAYGLAIVSGSVLGLKPGMQVNILFYFLIKSNDKSLHFKINFMTRK